MMHTEKEARKLWPILGWRFGHSKGYVRIYCPEHPNAGHDGYLYAHTYFATLVLGRGLKKNEMAHHIDGNPANNKNDNLLVCSSSYHREMHYKLARSDRWPQFSTIKMNNRPTCAIDGCNKPVPYKSATGMCVTHYWDKVRNQPDTCSVDGCTERAGSRSGFCRKHLQAIHNRKRYAHV